MFGFSSGELLLIVLIALILFGNDKLPENIKKMIKGLNQAKKVAKDVQNSWQEVKIDVHRSIMLEEESTQIKSMIAEANVNLPDHASMRQRHKNLEINSVPQEDLDAYQDSLGNTSVMEQILTDEQETDSKDVDTTSKPLTPFEYISSQDFVGPRL